MRLLAHNLLMCNVKNCESNNYPLNILVEKSIIIECDFKKDGITKIISKLDWAALSKTVHMLGNNEFPIEYAQEMLQDDVFLKELHRILYETHIVEGSLQCPNCNRKYPISNGIPNMILNEDEI